MRRCIGCRKEWPATGPTNHFRARRKRCRTCLEGLPEPVDAVVVVPRPRALRRWWPENVVAHVPRKPAEGPCSECGEAFERIQRHQVTCGHSCQMMRRNRLARERAERADDADPAFWRRVRSYIDEQPRSEEDDGPDVEPLI